MQRVILNGGTNTVSMTGATDFIYLYGGSGTNTLRLGVGGGYELATGGTNHMFGATGGSGTVVFVGGIGSSDMHGGAGNQTIWRHNRDAFVMLQTYGEGASVIAGSLEQRAAVGRADDIRTKVPQS